MIVKRMVWNKLIGKSQTTRAIETGEGVASCQ